MVQKVAVTRKEMIERIFSLNNSEISKSLIESVLNSFFSELKSSVLNGEFVSFAKYFSMWSDISKPRVAVNMKTREKMTIPERVTPKFKFSGSFREEVAKNGKVNS